MTSSRPYFIRAVYEWIVDNNQTPFLVVDTRVTGAVVPESFIEDQRIIFNISPLAAQGLDLSNEAVSFSARFGGKAMDIYLPTSSITAIYAKENGQGMMFNNEQALQDDSATNVKGLAEAATGAESSKNKAKGQMTKKPTLKVIK